MTQLDKLNIQEIEGHFSAFNEDSVEIVNNEPIVDDEKKNQ